MSEFLNALLEDVSFGTYLFIIYLLNVSGRWVCILYGQVLSLDYLLHIFPGKIWLLTH